MKWDFIKGRTWAEIDLDALAANFAAVKKHIRGNAKLCCTVKANAYGHGATQTARLFEELGADMLAVSNVEEALQLRMAGIQTPLLILGYTPPTCAAILAEYGISQCVFSADYAEQLSASVVRAGVSLRVHIKIDTGMGRLGFPLHREGEQAEHEFSVCLSACRLPGLITEGIFTHFASADEGMDGRAFTLSQLQAFLGVVERLEQRGVHFALRHCANSAAILDYPETHLDMVRAGIVLYGMPPSERVTCVPPLKPVMSFCTLVDFIKEIQTGDTVSYGRTYAAPTKRRVATLPIGYADGLRRADGPLYLAVRGQRAPIVGRICMDQTMIDVTDIPDVAVGDTVTVFGASGAYSVSELAARYHTIPYEILCGVGERVVRVYDRNGKMETAYDAILHRWSDEDEKEKE